MSNGEPLGAPPGSVRAVLALVIVVAVMLPYMVRALFGHIEVPSTGLLVLVSAAAGAYGISRAVGK